MDRSGKTVRGLTQSGAFECGLDLSPDGTQLVTARTEAGSNGCHLWVYDLGGSAPTPLMVSAGNEEAPRVVSSNDGVHVLFVDVAGKGIVGQIPLAGRGVPKILFEGNGEVAPVAAGALTRDGRTLILSVLRNGTGSDIMKFDLIGQDAVAAGADAVQRALSGTVAGRTLAGVHLGSFRAAAGVRGTVRHWRNRFRRFRLRRRAAAMARRWPRVVLSVASRSLDVSCRDGWCAIRRFDSPGSVPCPIPSGQF